MKLVLGAVQFGLPYGITNQTQSIPSDTELEDILDYAFSNGIKVIDTAEAYGEANHRVAKYLKKSKNRFQIINKILRFPLTNESEIKVLKETLVREKEAFEISCFEGVMLHYAPAINHLITPDFLSSLKEEGICKKIGLSINHQTDYFLVNQRIKIDFLQVPFNILNQNILGHDFVKHLQNTRCDIHVRSIFLQGLLLGEVKHVPHHLKELAPYLNALRDLSARTGESLITLCFAFVLLNSFVDQIVIGVQSKKELVALMQGYDKARELIDKGFLVNWLQYSCKNQALVDPTQWHTLQKMKNM